MDSNNLIRGAWDIHVHADPSLFPRWGDAQDLVNSCRAHDMAGLVLKFHHGSSVETASVLNKHTPGIQVFGGITLNYFVGGLNPHAVDAALSLGAKIVWLPTIHAANHEAACGCLGGFGFQKSSTHLDVDQGIQILGKQDKPVDPLKRILELLHDRPVVLATGHISLREIRHLQNYIKREGLNIRLLINHVFFKTPDLTVEEIKELINPRTWFETVYLSISPMVAATTAKSVADKIIKVPEARWIMATDTGQQKNPASPEALLSFSRSLMDAELAPSRIESMIKSEPASLLGVDINTE